jgi:hypothetical protein
LLRDLEPTPIVDESWWRRRRADLEARLAEIVAEVRAESAGELRSLRMALGDMLSYNKPEKYKPDLVAAAIIEEWLTVERLGRAIIAARNKGGWYEADVVTTKHIESSVVAEALRAALLADEKEGVGE